MMIDLRSDLCSVPTDEMWEAMRKAELGWATVGEDASVNELCGRVAELLGKAAATWVPTCGMANLTALLTFCEPGDHVVLESASHVLTSEAMGITEIARLRPAPVWAEDGRMDPAEVEELIVERRPILLVLENTHTRAGGTTLSPEQTEALADAAKRHGCRVHIDGARLVNAAVALGVPLADLAAPANSVVMSLNKGLSAPFGAVLVGSDAVVGRAREMLHRLGGSSVHRAGIAAAAGLVALDTMLDRVADDHLRARSLAAALAAIPGVTLRPEVVETNIVLADVSGTGIPPEELVGLLGAAGVRVLERDTSRIRLVTHRLIGDAEVERAVSIVAEVVDRHAAPPVVPELDYDWEAELDAYAEEEETQERG
jgi:threonine aldolase